MIETKMNICLECIDLLDNKNVFIVENFTSLDGYIYQNSCDINSVIEAFNSDIDNDGYKAIDVFAVYDSESGDTVWETIDD
jgi:hypothetical protein